MNISLQNISKSYAKKQVLNDISTILSGGNSYALLGKNGVGKTTLINTLINLVKPDSGKFELDERPLDVSTKAWKQRIGVVSDDLPLVPQMTGRECLEFHAYLYKIPRAEAEQRTLSLLGHFFDDEKDWNKEIQSYSTGMRKKVEICAAVMHTPDVLILDEPFSGLDPIAAQELIAFLNNYRRQDRIVLISSHDLAYVEKCVSHVLVLDEGTFKFEGTLEAFLEAGDGKIDSALYQLLVPKQKSGDELSWMK